MTNTTESMVTQALKPCPFCGVALTIRNSVNPSARCDTEGCWMNARMIAIPLDDPRQTTAWDTRTAAQPEREAVLEEAAKAMENLCFFTPVEELAGMTKQEMSVRTCHAGAEAIRALKTTPSPTTEEIVAVLVGVRQAIRDSDECEAEALIRAILSRLGAQS